MVTAVSSPATSDWGLATAAEGGDDREHHRLFEKRVHDGNLGDVYQYDSVYRVVRNPQNVNLTGVPAGTEILSETFASQDEIAYAYDGVQNRNTHTKTTAGTPVVTTYTLQAGPPPRDAEVNQYTATQEGGNPAVGYVYDENGNLKSDGTLDYFYDFKNRLVEVRQTVGGALVAQYSFDTANRRGMKVTPTETIVFLYDGIQCVEERDQTNAITRQYVWGPGADELLQQQTPTAIYYAHENSIGSVCALTDATGAVVERYQYDPFGNTTVTLNGNTGNRYRFHAAYFDSETGLYFMRDRTQHPGLGRFIQRDPIGIWSHLGSFGNGLSFVGNDGINWRDPTGNIPVETLWDIWQIGEDIQDIWEEGPSWENVGTLAGDVVGGLTPYVPSGFGTARRGARALGKGGDLGKGAGKVPLSKGAKADALKDPCPPKGGSGKGKPPSKNSGKTVSEILRKKKGGIKQAPLPPGSPSWDDFGRMTWEEIEAGAQRGAPGFKQVRKLLTDKRFDR